jgi:hypothetical protein
MKSSRAVRNHNVAMVTVLDMAVSVDMVIVHLTDQTLTEVTEVDMVEATAPLLHQIPPEVS